MAYDEMRNTDRTADFQKIGKMLGVCYPTYEQFENLTALEDDATSITD